VAARAKMVRRLPNCLAVGPLAAATLLIGVVSSVVADMPAGGLAQIVPAVAQRGRRQAMPTSVQPPVVTADNLILGLILLAPVLVVVGTGILVLLIDLVIADWLSRASVDADRDPRTAGRRRDVRAAVVGRVRWKTPLSAVSWFSTASRMLLANPISWVCLLPASQDRLQPAHVEAVDLCLNRHLRVPFGPSKIQSKPPEI
jgi:hypothetical protein